MADLIGAGLDRTVLSLRPFLSESRFGKNLPVTMLGHGVRLTISEYLAATALVAVILWAVLGLLMQES